MTDEKPDFMSTTQVFIKVLSKKITPAALWSVIGALVTALVVAITWLVTMQSDVHQLKESAAESKKSVADIRQQLEPLHQIDTALAVMNNKLDSIATEQDRQRAWRERIEDVADSPPHARHRR